MLVRRISYTNIYLIIYVITLYVQCKVISCLSAPGKAARS